MCVLVIGKFYLVDVGYACKPRFLPPYRGTRYHLKEYSRRNYPTNTRELFNLRHSSLRVIVERAFGALKNRFRIIDNKPFHPFRTQVKLVLACCILHNWILRHGVDEVIPEEFSWVPNNNGTDDHLLHGDDNAAWAHTRDEGMKLLITCGQTRETLASSMYCNVFVLCTRAYLLVFAMNNNNCYCSIFAELCL